MDNAAVLKKRLDLKAYLVRKDGRLNEREGGELLRLAQSCGISPGYLYRVALGHKAATARLACDIEHFTTGAVNRRTTLSDFPWDFPLPRQRSA